MKKQITIANLIVMPLIASAIFLASPAMASSGQNGMYRTERSGTEMSDKKRNLDGKRGIVGTVKSITGTVIIVTGMDKKEYTVDASKATVMKAGSDTASTPTTITVGNIAIGDTLMIKGTLTNLNMVATNIFDGKMPVKHEMMNSKKGIAGTVKSITGAVIIVTGVDGKDYTVDASKATVMKASTTPNVNPTIVTLANIVVGDTIMVRGTLSNLNMSATNIFDGQLESKHLKNFKGKNGMMHGMKK